MFDWDDVIVVDFFGEFMFVYNGNCELRRFKNKFNLRGIVCDVL